MNALDSTILSFINQFSRVSQTVDYTIIFLGGNHLLKGGLLASLLWWGWYRGHENQHYVREHVISTLLSCLVAIVLAKTLTLTLPFRLRPIHEAGVDFLLPYGTVSTALEGWSSFPSDHAVLFYTLSTGLLFVSRAAGIFALVYTTVFIGLPRIYLGLHYPTDIIGGAVVGILVGWLGNTPVMQAKIARPILAWSNTMPGFFYPVFFLITYQIADTFKNSRAILEFIRDLFQGFPGQ